MDETDQTSRLPLNPKEAIASLIAGLPPRVDHTLSFSDKCAALCVLRTSMPRSVVMGAFGITAQTASYLATCVPLPELASLIPESETGKPLAHPPVRRGHKSRLTSNRYQDVAAEFHRLGEDTFERTYYTEEVHVRLARARHLGEIKERAANRKANKYRGPINTSNGEYLIDWRTRKSDPTQGGWLIVEANEGHAVEGAFWFGQERFNNDLNDVVTPFFTSAEARKALLSWYSEATI